MSCRCHRVTMLVRLAALLVVGQAAAANAQDVVLAGRGPRFLVASAKRSTPAPLDLRTTPVLRQTIALRLDRVPLPEALSTITRATGLAFVYGVDLLPAAARVSVQAEQITVAAALTQVLLDTDLDVLLLESGRQVALVRRGSTGIPVPGQGAIAGRITDGKTGAGVPGVEVFLLNTQWGTTTDIAGRYHLEAVDAGNYTLAARRFGYTRQEQPVTVAEGQTDTVDLALTPVATSLSDIVTTATGQRRRVELANDVTTINADSVVRTQPVSSVTDILETRVPGLSVQHTSGAPGDPSRLRLRGAGSPLQSNDPIVVVDGIRQYAASDRNANLASPTYVTPSPLDYLDPNSIETIEVLKGPSAATLYGPDAANGVIVITTKKGKAGPPRWNATATYGSSKIPGSFPDLLVRWGHTLDNNLPVTCPVTNKVASTGVDCDADSLVHFQLLNDPALTVLDKGQSTVLSLGVSGGTSGLRYSVQGSYGSTDGLPKLPDYEAAQYQALVGTPPPDWMLRPQHLMQWNVTSSLSADLGPKAQVTLSSVLGRTAQQRSSLENQLGSLMATYFDHASGVYYQQGGASGYELRPVTSDVLAGYYTQVTDAATNLTNSLNLDWRPKTWFTVTSKAGLNYIQRNDRSFLPPGIVSDAASGGTGLLNYGRGNSLVSSLDLQGVAKAPLGRGFQFQFAMGANYISTSTEDVGINTTNVPPGTNLIGSATASSSAAQRDDATFGWYMEPSVNNSRIFLNLGLRLDGGNAYGSKVNGLSLPKFPKLGFSYLISDESFYPFGRAVPELRLRVSYGKASRQPGPTDRLRLYTAPVSTWFDGQYVNAAQLTNLGNTDLRPEITGEFEGGFDASFFRERRLSLSVTTYRKTTTDALVSFQVPLSVYGQENIQKNIGVVRNTGLEIQATAPLLQSDALSWSTRVQYSRNRNVVVKLGDGIQPFYGSGGRVAPGYPLFGRWETPIVEYADANGNGVVEQSEILLGDTAVYVGATLPNYEVDFSSDLTFWRAFTASATVQYQNGLSQYNNVARNLVAFSSGWNDATSSPAEQVATSTKTDYNWIQTVNVLRFNALALSYRMPSTLARRVGAQTLSIAVQGRNLGLHTNYRGIDPNVTGTGLRGNDVVDNGEIPQPRIWQVRVNATY